MTCAQLWSLVPVLRSCRCLCPMVSTLCPVDSVPLNVLLYLPISLPLSSLCLCHSVSVSASLSLSISLSRCSVTLSPSLFHSVAVPISPSLRPSFSAPLSPSLSLCHSVSVPVPFLCLCLGPSPSVCLSPFPVLFYPFKHVQLRNKNSKLILYILTLIPCTVLTESCITNRIFNRAKMFHNQIL